MNEHKHFSNFDKMPPGEIERMLFNAANSPKDGLIFMCTQGIVNHDPGGSNPGAQMTVAIKDPPSIVICLWNMAMTFNRVDCVLRICDDLEYIATTVRLNIQNEINKRRLGN